MKNLIKLFILTYIVSFTMYACDSNDTEDDTVSSNIELTLTGDVSGTYTFNFVYFDNLSDQEYGEHFFMHGSKIDADENDPELVITFVKPGSMVSATTYPVLDVEAGHEEYPLDHFHVSMSVNDPVSGDNFMGLSTDGTVSFSTASSNRVEGALNIQFMGIPLGGSGQPFTFTAQGEFIVGGVESFPN